MDATRNAVGDVGKYPNILPRCIALGDQWAFAYDFYYRGLSSWQHGDTSRAFLSQALKHVVPDQAERNVFETIAQCIFTWEIVYLCIYDLQRQCNDEQFSKRLIEVDNKGSNMIGGILAEAKKKFQGPET